MKKLLILALISLIGIQVFPQTEKGTVIVFSGTDLTMAFGKSVFENGGVSSGNSQSRNISVSFGAGVFIADYITVGIQVPMENSYLRSDNGTEEQFSYGIMPFSRVYLASSSINPYLTFGAGYMHISYLAGLSGGSLFDGMIIEGGLGFTAFISERIGLDTQLLYDFSQMKNNEENSLKLQTKAWGLQVGFSILF